ncbi:DNA-directed RNA polymerase III subunit RPC4 [Chionoecetes opilio]|uniref:DNA-directed RNA polymerase III subunit RPC4 n=1 Tax=Chionoecetes opilio TaxID=41210 RepID=A0A8J5CG54_CHIOP|nr:DNA-directed RNA polymerase III subunit RPC4 [Chionoecetes opilio]
MAEQNGTGNPTPSKGQGAGRGSPAGSSGGTTSTRLPTFRAPRDLTLSATTTALVKPSLMTRTRKTFLPNIPSRREKVDNSYETHSEKATKRRDKNIKKEGGRGRGRAKEYIQTTGSLFGEGIGLSSIGQRRGTGGGYGGFGRGGGGGGGTGKSGEAGYVHKPVLNLDAVNNIDKEHEDQKLKEILRDDFIDDPDYIMGQPGEEDLFPVQLPLLSCGQGFKEGGRGFKEEGDVKSVAGSNSTLEKLEVKAEPGDHTEEAKTAAPVPETKMMDRKMSLKGGLPTPGIVQELSVAQLLSGKHEEFMFFQLPNSLPSHPPEVKQEPNVTYSQPQQQQQQQQKASGSTEPEEEEKKAGPQYCTVNTLPEGKIGTIKVYKSGKVELWLGNHKLAVNKGTQVGFLQDVVNVDVDQEAKTGALTVLGHVGHRLVCTPDLEELVKQMKT